MLSLEHLPSLDTLQHPDGRYLSDPKDIDSLLQSTWEGVYAGNSTNHATTIVDYFRRYAEFIFVAPEFQLSSITYQDVYATIQDCPCTAGGMDQWQYSDWKLLPRRLFNPSLTSS
eukprot:32560-Karenia_brevis.AAC.1